MALLSAPSGPWPGVLLIGGDHSHHHVDERSTLCRCEHGQQALLSGASFRTLLFMQPRTTRREGDLNNCFGFIASCYNPGSLFMRAGVGK